MSSLPGLTLEDYLLWNFNILVMDREDANFSLGLAEELGNIPQRKILTEEQFSYIVQKYEIYRDCIEYRLDTFDEETQSWRDYSPYVDSCVPNSNELDTEIKQYIKLINNDPFN